MNDIIIDWVIGGVIGAAAYALLQGVICPLIADWLFYKTPKVRGRWNATIETVTPDGAVHNNSEVVFVKQWGNRVWAGQRSAQAR